MITIRIEVDADETRVALVQVVDTQDRATALYTIEPGDWEDITLQEGEHIEIEHDEIDAD